MRRLALLLLLAFAQNAQAGQTPDPINAPSSIAAGHVYVAGASRQQAADGGVPLTTGPNTFTGLQTINNGTGTSLTSSGTGIFGTGGAQNYSIGAGGLSISANNFTINFPAANGAAFTAGSNGTALIVGGLSGTIANQITLAPSLTGSGPTLSCGGSDANVDCRFVAKGTGLLRLVSPVIIPNSFNPNFPSQVLSGAAPTLAINEASSAYSGTLSTNAPLNAHNNVSDTINAGANTVTYNNWLYNFGGTSMQGNRNGYVFSFNQAGAISDSSSGQAYVGTSLFATFSYNAGGTGTTASLSRGNGFSFYPQTLCQPGATYFFSCGTEEDDLALVATSQTLTVGGTSTNGDTLTVTFTGASISGSPVSVTVTAGTSNTLPVLANKIMAAIIGNSALAAAGVSSSPATAATAVLNIFWPQPSTITVSVSASGGATETLTLGSVVAGASAYTRRQKSIIGLNQNSAQGYGGFGNDAAAVIGSQWLTPTSGQYLTGLQFGVPGGTFPIAYGGKLIASSYQIGISSTGNSGPLAPMRAYEAVDFSDINFTLASGYSLNLPNFKVDGSGKLIDGPGTILGSSAGLTIDVPGYVGTSCAISAGGGGGAGIGTGNYYATDILDDAQGGQYQPSSINSSTGAISALNTLVAPSVLSSPPGSPVSLTHGSGSSATVSCSWNQPLQLALNPSGSVKFAGAAQWSANGSVATTVTSLGPAGSHTTIQEWFTIIDSAGVTRYIPAY